MTEEPSLKQKAIDWLESNVKAADYIYTQLDKRDDIPRVIYLLENLGDIMDWIYDTKMFSLDVIATLKEEP